MSRAAIQLATLTMAITASTGLTGCSQRAAMSEKQFNAFVEECKQELQPKLETAITKWHFDTFKRYDLDQTTGTLVFTDDTGRKFSCTVQVVGTFSTASQTWLWSWASPWVTDALKRDAEAVREFGRTNGVGRLTTDKWAAKETDGWAMTAVAARVAGAESAYRLPNRDAFIFMLIKRVETVTELKP